MTVALTGVKVLGHRMTGLDVSSVAPTELLIERPDHPVRLEIRSVAFIAVLLRGGVCGVVLGAAAVAWELTSTQFSTFFALSACMSLVVLMLRGDLRMRMVPDLTRYIPRVLAAVTSGTGVALLVSSSFGLWNISGEVIVVQLAVLTLAMMLGVSLGLRILRSQWRAGRLRSRAIIMGTSDLAVEFAVEISQRASYGVSVVGLVGAQVADPAGAPFLGGIDRLPALVERHGVDRLIVMPGIAGDGAVLRSLRWANTRPGLSVFVVPRFFDLGLGMDSVSPDRVRGYPLTQLERVSHRGFGLAAKRMFDVFGAGLALLALAPLLVVVAVAVKLSDRKGPVFFRQERVGLYGEPINILKFRSMRVSEAGDTEWMGEAEARITRVGALLRRTSLDEIPQLFNVVRGDMSLVGPRPERPAFVEEFSASIPGYADRHRMRVGLTGLAQIVGLRGNTSIGQRVKYDNIYIDQWRFIWDVEILIKTVMAVVRANRYAADEQAVERLLQPDKSVNGGGLS